MQISGINHNFKTLDAESAHTSHQRDEEVGEEENYLRHSVLFVTKNLIHGKPPPITALLLLTYIISSPPPNR